MHDPAARTSSTSGRRWLRTPPRGAASLGLAALLDAFWGDPPNAAHPVVVLGRTATFARRLAPADASARRVYGVLAALAIPATTGLAALAVERAWPRSLGGRTAASAVLINLATSRRTLLARANEVADALDVDDLSEARRLLAYHLVSRDTSELDAPEVAAAAVESVAENLHDGVVAPWCAAAIGGASAAWIYRAMNTLDSMWGYHEPFLEELGMGAARFDDILNLLPARLSAAAICVAAAVHERDSRGAWLAWRRDRAATTSPNAGHPMAAMAGALGVTLSKRGAYTLNASGRRATVEDIRRACDIANTAAWLVLGALLATRAVSSRR